MRATRGYLASLGTTGLLALAAFAVLITASALLAFNGWPREEAPDGASAVLIDPGSELSADTGPGEVAARAAEAADEVAFVPDSADGGGGGNAPGDGTPGNPGDGDPGDGGPGDGTPGLPTDPSPPSGGGGGTPPGGGGIELPGGGIELPDGGVTLTDGLADGAESATEFLGASAVLPVSPELGQVVTGTGQALTDLVRALDGTPAPPR